MAVGTLRAHPAARLVRAALREEGLREPRRASPRARHRHPQTARCGTRDLRGREVVVKHLFSGDYRVFHGEECIAWANGSRPKPSTGKNNDKDEQLG